MEPHSPRDTAPSPKGVSDQTRHALTRATSRPIKVKASGEQRTHLAPGRAVVSLQSWLAAYTDKQHAALLEKCDQPPWSGLRFAKTERVMFNTNQVGGSTRHHGSGGMDVLVAQTMTTEQDWNSGVVVKCWQQLFLHANVARQHRQNKDKHASGTSLADGDTTHHWAPYQILLDSGAMVLALRDTDACVRAVGPDEGVKVSAARRSHLVSEWKSAPRALLAAHAASQVSEKVTNKADHLIQNLDAAQKSQNDTDVCTI